MNIKVQEGVRGTLFNFKNVSTVMAVIAFTLFCILLLAPEVIFTLFQVPGNESAYFIARRAALLFLGIGVISWYGRSAAHSESRQAICIGLSASMLALAALGLFEFARGSVGLGIFLAVAAEVLIGGAYFRIWYSNRMP